MKSTVPELDVYYIDFTPVEEESKKAKEENSIIDTGLAVAAAILPPAWRTGVLLSKEVHKELKRFFDKNLFHVIRTPEELQQFENAHGNEWVVNDKTAKKRQYYIRHPKLAKRNILIEAKGFHDYIETEHREEVIHYILSHCKAKSIQIDRVEASSFSALGSVPVKGLNWEGNADARNIRGSYYKCEAAKGLGREKARDEYYWLDKDFMLSINNMKKKGTVLETKMETDFTFGLKGGEAKTLGLEAGRQKKYTYYVRVVC